MSCCVRGARPKGLVLCASQHEERRRQNWDAVRGDTRPGRTVRSVDAGALAVASQGGVDVWSARSMDELHDAASLGRVDAVRGSLDSGVAVDGSILSGRTALQAACEFGHVDVVTLLLDRGASVDRADQHGYTPLHRACLEDGSAEVVRLLLARGADFERTSERGWLPLHVACSAGRSIAARLLLDLGTEVDRTNGEGATPMWVACREGQHTTVRLCLERGADINWARVGSTMQDVCRINEYEVMEGWLARIRASAGRVIFRNHGTSWWF